MPIWEWIQPVNRIWQVVTDSEKGVIETYNEDDEMISEQENLGKDGVFLIEEHFLKIVATKLTDGDTDTSQKTDGGKEIPEANKHEYNSMYA